MNCDCEKRVSGALLEKFKEATPEARRHSSHILGYGINFYTGKSSMTANVEQEAIYPLKKGGERAKKTKTFIAFNYCPFCGVSTEVKPKINPAAAWPFPEGQKPAPGAETGGLTQCDMHDDESS